MSPGSKVLLAYFSRAGENFYYGGRTTLDVGNTEIVAGMISSAIRVDTFRIEAADPYPVSYSETVERNVQEQNGRRDPLLRAPCPTSPATTPCYWAVGSGMCVHP